jgi:Flp pilus assembly pilin Flp
MRAGQVTIEYFLLLTVVALLTLIGFARFDDDVRASLQGFFNDAAAKITR